MRTFYLLDPKMLIFQAILSHYNSNADDTIEGPELYAFIGDISRHLGLKLSLPVIQAGIATARVSVDNNISCC